MTMPGQAADISKETLLAWKRGSVGAFEKIVRSTMKRAYSVALGLVGNIEDARDLSQESYMAAHHARKSFDVERPFFPWFYRILRNRCLNFIEKQCDECREALESFSELRALTGRIKMKDPTDEFWEGYWKSIYRRIERKTAWIFIIAGALMLIAYEVYRATLSFGKVTFEKVALVLFIVGAVLLLISVVRERVHQYKTDRYKDIER
ncbi:MAG: sigma-70 family RNA polymerase sigma factor [Candidatus Krumholzibacteria bacterium]|nr:sigma-70 family RNA polymerase sigma factor [Candidatus Krumholzibacteria bacterium]